MNEVRLNAMKKTNSLIVSSGVTFLETGAKFDKRLSFDEWENLVGQLARIEKASQWWIGDALNYGEWKYGEVYAQAIDDHQKKTWQNYKFVANHIEISRRREIVSWSVHAEVASLEPGEQDKFLGVAEKTALTEKQMRAEVKKYKRALLAAQAQAGEMPLDVIVTPGDFRPVMANLPDNSIDMIFTDPPYDEKSIPLYGDLARLAAQKLKVGASLIAYTGHYAIGEVYNLMAEHLRYWWIIADKHNGNSARLIGKNVFVEWKPLLWFVKERRGNKEYVADLFESEMPDKLEHDWQQDTSEAEYYIEQLTNPGDLVVDPFCGSGTTLLAAKRLSRRALGIEIDMETVNVAKHRLQTES